MGNQSSSQSSSTSSHAPDLRDWKAIGEGENYQIWRNSSTHQQLEEYIFTATDGGEFSMMKRVFQFRFEKDYLVASRYFKEQNNAEICSTFYQGHTFIERIPLRLNEIKDLPHPDSLHLLNSCLRGFKELYGKIGSFDINDHMIGINCEAKVKVWLNADFGKGRNQDNIKVRKEEERRMVSDIISLVDKVVDHRSEPESLTEYISKNFSPNFQEALTRLDEYLIRHQVSIPPYLISIALLRDRGYFKKMTPRLGTSIDGARLTEMRVARERDENQMRKVSFNLGSAAGEAFSPGRRIESEIPGVNYQVPIPVPPTIAYSHPPSIAIGAGPMQPSFQPITHIPPPPPLALQPRIHHSPQTVIHPSLSEAAINSQNAINTTSVVTPFNAPIPFRFPHKTRVSAHQGINPPKPLPALVSIPNQIELKLIKVTTPNQSQEYTTVKSLGHHGLPHLQLRNQNPQPIQQPSIPQLTHQQQPTVKVYQSNQSNVVSSSETGNALDRILQQTRELELVSQQPANLSHSPQEGFTIYNTKSQRRVEKVSTGVSGSDWNKQGGYTNPQLLKLHVKDFSSTTSYSPSYSPSYQPSSYQTSSYRHTEGGTDPSLLSKAVSGILNLLDKKPQSSYEPNSSQTFSHERTNFQGTSPDLLSKLTDFKSPSSIDRGSVDSNFTFFGKNDTSPTDLLTTLMVGGIIAAPENRLRELVGSGTGVGIGSAQSFDTARFGGGSFDSHADTYTASKY